MKFIVFLLAIALFSACHTAPPKPIISEPIIHEVSDIRLELRYLNENELRELHGSNDVDGYKNPYYKFPSLITKQRLIVFELTVNSTITTVSFKLQDIDLSIGRISGNAKSRQYLERIWNSVDNVFKQKMKKTLQQTLLDREFTIEPGTTLSGYLVFGENYPPEGGEGLITMFVSTPDGDEGTIDIPVLFSADGKPKTSRDEPSIFSDTSQ